MNYMDGLNPEQEQAVKEIQGYVRVVAGAGSGKTRTLTSRVSYLIDQVGITPENVLAVTFTNKAANEMKMRIKRYLGDAAEGVLVMTFGALEARIIREDGRAIGYPKSFQILDEEDKKRLLKKSFDEARERFPDVEFDKSIKVRYLKSSYDAESTQYSRILLMSLDGIQRLIDDAEKGLRNAKVADVIHYILLRYTFEKRKSFALDFNNLPYFAGTILDESEIARKKWQEKLQYIMVDEYQDVSETEVALLTTLQERHKNLFVVGDNDQTIYSFRGANVSYFMNFDKTFSPAKTIMLLRNYRSGSDVLNVSNTLIQKNTNRFDKNLIAEKQETGKVVYSHAETGVEEAKFVADNIVHFHEQGIKYSDIAILYRAHSVSRSFEEQLLKANVPYRIFSGVGFYQRREIKDIIAYMRLIIDGDDISFSRVNNEPRRGIGPKTFKEISELAKANNTTLLSAFLSPDFDKKEPQQKFADFISKARADYQRDPKAQLPSELMMTILRETGYEEMLRDAGDEERLDNLTEFKSSLVEQEETGELQDLEEYLQNITLLTSQDANVAQDTVNMMTIHTAKGLEFPVVFVVGLNEGIFPSSRIKNSQELEEERRLAYVAYTRAENNLILTDSEGWTYDGNFKYPSRFIFDAERVGIEYLVELDERLLAGYETQKHFSNDKNVQNFEIGDVVEHDIFGRGIVEENNGYSVRVAFENGNSTNINASKLSFNTPRAYQRRMWRNVKQRPEPEPYYGDVTESVIKEAEVISIKSNNHRFFDADDAEPIPYYGEDDPIWQKNSLENTLPPEENITFEYPEPNFDYEQHFVNTKTEEDNVQEDAKSSAKVRFETLFNQRYSELDNRIQLIKRETVRTPLEENGISAAQAEPDQASSELMVTQSETKTPVATGELTPQTRTQVNLPPIDWTPRSKAKVLLLTFFLGYFGVHEFYLGKTKLGIAHLLMGTIGLIFFLGTINIIWVIVEFIGIATSKPGTEWHRDGYGIELED